MAGPSDEGTMKNVEILEYVDAINKAAVEDSFFNSVALAVVCVVTFFVSFLVSLCALHALEYPLRYTIIVSFATTIFMGIGCFKRYITTSRSYQLLTLKENKAFAYAKWLLAKFDNKPLCHKLLKLHVAFREPLPTVE